MSSRLDQAGSVAQSLAFTQPWCCSTARRGAPRLAAALAPDSAAPLAARPSPSWGCGSRSSRLLVGALAEPTLRPPGTARAVVFALDVSDSVSAAQQSWARDWIARARAALPPGSQADTVVFGTRAQLDGAGWPPGSATDLSAALQLAGTLLPRDPVRRPTVVLFTDGWPTASGSPPHSTGCRRGSRSATSTCPNRPKRVSPCAV